MENIFNYINTYNHYLIYVFIIALFVLLFYLIKLLLTIKLISKDLDEIKLKVNNIKDANEEIIKKKAYIQKHLVDEAPIELRFMAFLIAMKMLKKDKEKIAKNKKFNDLLENVNLFKQIMKI